MIRILLTVILPLLAPTLAYMMWLKIQRDRARAKADGTPVPEWETLPWPTLIGVGAALAIAGLFFFGLSDDSGRQTGKYHPAKVIDGELIPGYFEKADEEKSE